LRGAIGVAFARRLLELTNEKYGSVEKFLLETTFPRKVVSGILRGRGDLRLAMLAKLADSLDVDLWDLFVFPVRGPRDQIIDLVRKADAKTLRQIRRPLSRPR
jgi:hypothetical protein